MKVLWIVNSVLNGLSEYLYSKPSDGVWMDALLEDFRGKDGYNIVVATTLKIKSTIKYTDKNITYYALPDNVPILYNENKTGNIRVWKKMIEEEKPDIIQVWGTEFTHGLCALKVAKNIPSIVYIQGCVGTIAKYYQAGISYKEIKKTITFRDIIKRDSIFQQQKKYYKQAEKEKEMLEIAGNIISENLWCDANLNAVVPNLTVYHCPLSINKVFFDKRWEMTNAEKHSVICTASGYTIKGLHMLLHALALVKRKYKDVKLYVPGTPQVSDGSLQWTLRKNGYTNYIEKLIKRLDLNDNIVWLNRLSQEKLAEEYAKRRVFVMPSAIENHSSSLKEAMIVGMPCISSYVGGIPEYVSHGENGLLYRYEEYALLAEYIVKLFEDDELCLKLSANARNSMLKFHASGDQFDRITSIYKNVKGVKK